MHGMPFSTGILSLPTGARVYVSGANHKSPLRDLEALLEVADVAKVIVDLNGGMHAIGTSMTYCPEFDGRLTVTGSGAPHGALHVDLHGSTDFQVPGPALVQRAHALALARCTHLGHCPSCLAHPGSGGYTASTNPGDLNRHHGTANAETKAVQAGAGRQRLQQTSDEVHIYPHLFATRTDCGCQSWVGGVILKAQARARCFRCSSPLGDLPALVGDKIKMAENTITYMAVNMPQAPPRVDLQAQFWRQVLEGARNIQTVKVYNLAFKALQQGLSYAPTSSTQSRIEQSSRSFQKQAKRLIIDAIVGGAFGPPDSPLSYQKGQEVLAQVENQLPHVMNTADSLLRQLVRKAKHDGLHNKVAVELTIKMANPIVNVITFASLAEDITPLRLPLVEVDRLDTVRRHLCDMQLLAQGSKEGTSTLKRIFGGCVPPTVTAHFVSASSLLMACTHAMKMWSTSLTRWAGCNPNMPALAPPPSPFHVPPPLPLVCLPCHAIPAPLDLTSTHAVRVGTEPTWLGTWRLQEQGPRSPGRPCLPSMRPGSATIPRRALQPWLDLWQGTKSLKRRPSTRL